MSKHKPDCPTDAALSRAKHQSIDSPVFDELTTEARRERLREARQDRATLARAYRAEKERRESAERVVDAHELHEYTDEVERDCAVHLAVQSHLAKYPKEAEAALSGGGDAQ